MTLANATNINRIFGKPRDLQVALMGASTVL
jgi:hypothetical protein